MIKVRLRDAMQAFERRTGERMTYERLAELTGLARTTLESIGTRNTYNAGLRTIDRICVALNCTPAELLEFHLPNGGEHNENII